MKVTDRVEKQLVLKASQSRVWKAISNYEEFSAWFGVRMHSPFVEGKTITGTFNKEMNEAAIMEYQKRNGVAPSKIKMPGDNWIFGTIEKVKPESYFSYRWIPYGVDAEADLENEETTLVEFHLSKVPEGTLLKIVESGFDRVPAHRRERAFRMNDGGWSAQAENIRRYVESK